MLCYKITPPGFNDPDALELKNEIRLLYSNNNMNIVQIGANDGISADPIYDFIRDNQNVNAYLVEPQNESFNLLVKNYANIKDRVKCFNYAITNSITKTDEKIKLYKNNAQNGTDGHSSLIVREKDICNDIVVADFNENSYELVDGISVKSFMEEIHNISIDVLIIDTEGYDLEIIKMFFDNNIYPKIIFFESPGIRGYIPNCDFLTGDLANDFLNENISKLYQIKKLNSNYLCILK